jgi:hypothetical protein
VRACEASAFAFGSAATEHFRQALEALIPLAEATVLDAELSEVQGAFFVG